MGAQSGEVAYPAYIGNFHSQLLMGETYEPLDSDGVANIYPDFSGAYNMEYLVKAALDLQNPYTGVNAFDPYNDLSNLSNRMEIFSQLADLIDEQDLWTDSMQLALQHVETYLPGLSDLSNVNNLTELRLKMGSFEGFLDNFEVVLDGLSVEVSAHRSELLQNLARSYNHIAGGLFDINGVVSSVSHVAFANLEAEFNRDMQRFQQDREFQLNQQKRESLNVITQARQSLVVLERDILNAEKDKNLVELEELKARLGYYMQSTQEIHNIVKTKIMSEAQAVTLQDGVSKVRIDAFGNEIALNADLDSMEIKWDMDLLTEGGKAMNIQAQGMTRGLSEKQQQLMLLATVAQIGSGVIGAIVPFLGMVAFKSDENLKTEIVPLENGLDVLNKLRPVRYQYKELQGVNQVGFIAQELREVIPEWIISIDGTLYVHPYGFEAVAVKAIQELSDKVDRLEKQLSGDLK